MMKGGGILNFDVGVEIGNNGNGGPGGNDIRTTTFTVFGISTADTDYSYIGVRLTPPAPVSGPTSDSAKIIGSGQCSAHCTSPPTRAPSTYSPRSA